MLLEYIQAALRHAKYEILPDDGSYYGEIQECNGVYASAGALEECREVLREVLDEWVLFGVHRNLPLPAIDGIELTIKEFHCPKCALQPDEFPHRSDSTPGRRPTSRR